MNENLQQSEKLQRRLEQLINQGEDLLKTAVERISNYMGVYLVFPDNGSELFVQWKHSSKKVLKLVSEDDYNGFTLAEKPYTMESNPNVLKRLVSILKASLDDLNYEILDINLMTKKDDKKLGDTIHYHNLNNYGNLSSHNTESTVNQASNLTVNKGDFGFLASQLKEHGVKDEDIQDLRNIIDVTPAPQSTTGYSEGVNSWIGRITVKAATESWDVVKGVGIAIFPELIKLYYGI